MLSAAAPRDIISCPFARALMRPPSTNERAKSIWGATLFVSSARYNWLYSKTSPQHLQPTRGAGAAQEDVHNRQLYS
jgi:hypothetical protein